MVDRWRDEDRYRRGYGSDFGPEGAPYGYGRDYWRDYGPGYYSYGPDYYSGRFYGRYPSEPGLRGERYRGAWYGAPRWWDYGRGGPGRADERGWRERTGDEVRSWFGDEEAERRRRMDEYRCRGPRDYTRSDERIREDVCDRLTDDPIIDASEIAISVANGEVTLSGTVDTRLEKRRAEDYAEDVSGVKNVHNQLRVEQSAVVAGTAGTKTAESARTHH